MSEQNTRIQTVLVIGAGWVGRQVAARMTQFGLTVSLCDPDPDICRDATQWIVQQLQTNDARWLPSPIRCCTSVEELHDDDRRGIDLVIECVPEQLSLKKRVLRSLGNAFPSSTVIVSNSSYFVPSLLSQFVSQPQRFAHLHFHVPVLRDSVVDVVGCSETSASVLERLMALVKRIGHYPLLLQREHPGYIFNWLLQSVLKSALELVAAGVADVRMIDKSWTSVTGMQLGPFGIMDQIGLDVIEQVLNNAKWSDVQSPDHDQLLQLIRQHADQGQLGTKTLRGFYHYDASGNILDCPDDSP